MIVPIKLENTQDISYDILIDKLPKLTFDTKVGIVTNPTVSALHLETLLSKIDAPKVHVITVPDGEEYKTLETVENILNELFEHKFDRKSLLIAFGGGVIGDMTGFTASLYQRGIDFIQVPTTLLSQVDASVGGKTGVNNKYGKNLIGAFYQPKAVYINPEFLETLPPREFAAGVAEIVKMAVMFDAEFFNFLGNADFHDEAVLKEMIRRSVELKAWVVNQDEKEAGIRAVLNYGHTFGHVIENETNYNTYLHGEAVAIGMVMANALAVELGLFEQEEADRVKRLLESASLPVSYEIKNVDAFYDHFFLDKKSAKGSIKFILPEGMGNHKIVNDIDEMIVKKVLKHFGADQ
ncbi:3-dehydroquinate synthase [Sulfurovum sp. zt1-1]|uniref:3-dehydroquinate synthase n=1 Tax=Sulfurovum zhangzhouensis TaxID=3019067 RepID=A0ABT7QYU3_9BACT|nr:3-dehydroquinate synthase [Sulfurovum zhangzhouensis]MDM5271936.1 3-dehydroquinate synthase [Sulfurovum zhangzhouensis]